MFQRVNLEDWADSIPLIAFIIFAVIFVLVTIRALRLRKDERERLAALPLDNHIENPQL